MKNLTRHIGAALILSVIVAGTVLWVPEAFVAHGATIDELRSRISEGNRRIEELTAEINQLTSQINITAKQSQTLQNALRQLELTKQKLAKDIALTGSRINSASATIEELEQEIVITEASIQKSVEIIAESLQIIAAAESESVIEEFLKNKTLSDAWDYVSSLSDVQERIRTRLLELRDAKTELSQKKLQMESEKKNLVTQQKNLADQKKAADYNSAETNKLLAIEKQKKLTYEQELAAKVKEKEAFEKELFLFESQLQIAIDPNSIPATRAGLLSWPLDNVYVTQNFGKTSSSGRLYSSGTHNGVDFRAANGTAVKAVLSGVVQATGNTDLQRGCYSYGKWILIRHANGISSLYAHLSVVSVEAGDTVVTGDRIGYSGNTGYSTGPHLHLTLLASQGVRVEKFSNSLNCKNVPIPLADVKAYLDPLAYLPSR